MDRELRFQKRSRRRIRTRLWGTLTALGAALIVIPATGIIPTLLLYNPSESAPHGWYRIEAIDAISRGDLVVASLPKEASELAVQRGYLPNGIPVIKTVAALEGDTVCEENGLLKINALPTVRVLAADSTKHPLPSPWKTCRPLRTGEVLLLSDRTPDSFDGRYFGPVQKTDIVGLAIWIGFAHEQRSEALKVKSGRGSECKIKAHGANEGASPCLHIEFYGSISEDIAPSSDRILNEHYRMGQFHSEELACLPPEQPE